jgi:TonB family protein
MSNKVLTYTIGISVGVNLLILGIIGGTSAAKPIDLDSLKLVKVDLVKTPNDISVSKPDEPKPEKSDEAEPEPYVPPVKQMETAKAPSRKAVEKIVQQVKYEKIVRAAAAKANTGTPGNSGGAINMGSTSANGQNLGGNGTSNAGYVPNPGGGQGDGSGNQAGTGTTEPTPAGDGDGTHTAPAPPSPAPAPSMVDVVVCAISHMKPGRYCERKVKESFREGGEPDTCNVCKEPEQEHNNVRADREEPELIKDCKDKIRIPESVMDEGIDATVTIGYTCEVDGSISDVKVTHSSGNRELDRAVVEAAKGEMKYKPAVQNGVPRAVKGSRTFRFKV